MGEKTPTFRLRTKPYFLGRLVFTTLYLLWAVAFIALSLNSIAKTNAASGDRLEISSIHLDTITRAVDLVDHRFSVPDAEVGAYSAAPNKTFLMGHKSTIFKDLVNVAPSDEITFAGTSYLVTNISIEPKAAIDMSEILADTPEKTLILMTCAGEPLDGSDYTHRLIITATEI